MNRKLRVLMLSLAVVMFSVASAFAAFESSDVASFVVSDSDIEVATTEGYNYMQRVFVDPDAWPEGETPRTVTWTIDPNLPSWLTYVIDGNTVTFRGILPAYDASKESYTVHAVANLDCDVVIGYDDDDEPIIAPGHIEADVDMDEETWTGGLVIEVEQADRPLGLYADLVSIDASEVDSRDVVDDKYSVFVNFPMSWTTDDDPSDESDNPRQISTDLYPNAQLECEQEGGRYVVGSDVLNLPQWMDYEVVSTQHGRALDYDEDKGTVTYPDDYPEDTETTYVASLKIFFTSKDYQPENDEKAVVRIVTDVSDVFSDTYEDGATIGWNVTYRSVPKIVVTPDTRALTVERGKSADTTFDYSVVAVSGTPTFSSNVPEGVTFTPTVTPENPVPPSGKIAVSVAATDAAQATATPVPVTMTVNDANGGTVTATINLTIVNPITITVSGDKLENVEVTEGSAAKQYTYVIGNPGEGLTWEILGNFASMISPTSGTGSNVNFTLDPTNAAPGNYTATLQARDNSGRSVRTQTFTWTVKPRPITISYADSDTVSVDFGASADLEVEFTYQEPVTVTFSPDISADVKLSWDKEARYLNGIPAGIITITAEPVTPRAKLYSTDIIVTDSGDNTASLPIFISVDVGVLSIEPVSASVRVELNTSKDVSFNAVNHSGVVSWDIGTVPSGITVSESVIPHATQYNANGLFTVTGVTLGTYSVDITATDERGEAVTATLYVDVTPRIVVTVSPDEAAIVVVRGKSNDVTFTAPTYSGDVSWDVGTVPAGLTVVPATGVAYATAHNTVMVYTVTAASTMAVGTYSVDITATDATGSRNATLNVNVVSEEPKLLTVTPASADASVVIGGASANVSFAASNNNGDVTWTLGTLPTGVTVAPATNVSYATQNNTRMVYTVTAASSATAGNYSVTVTAKDAAGRTATATISITVVGPVPPTQFTITPSSSTVTVRVGSAVNVSFTVAGTSETLAWSATGLPAGVSINPSTGRISGTPTTAGSYTATVTAKGSANEATATVSFTVEDVPVPPTPEEPTDETKELINKYESEGKLNSDGTIPSKAVSFTPTDPTAKTLNPNTTTTVKQGENLNPVALVLEFPVDIWKIYINNVLMAWAYSPGVTPAADDASIYASTGENGVIIEPSSKTEATVVFNTELMPAGNNQQIAAAFVPDVTKPTQEIGKTTLATVSVSGTTSPDEPIGVGGSSGGCDAGLGAIVLAMAATFFISKKRS